jgi:hypothetical protein
MAKRRCAACGCVFEPRRNVAQQRYCSKQACQRTRRRRWQRQKLKMDADYRANQAAAQRRWRERHPEYWRQYRQRHPDATARNREQQRERNRRRLADPGPSPPVIANMDAYPPERPVRSGTYRLVPVAAPGVAKMDAYLVEMHVLSDG